jgi:hypothetical protein
MKTDPQIHAELLVDRLAHALAGTEGRTISVASIRTLVSLETAEWNRETSEQTSLEHQTGALIVGASELFY